MVSSQDKPKNTGEVLRDWLRNALDFVFGYENKKGVVMDSWIYYADSFVISPSEFYARIEQQLQPLKVPGVELNRQEFYEGGLLSDRRVYLQLMRERLAITACAAPFGNLFFFSCRMMHIPVRLRLWHLIVVFASLFYLGRLLIAPLGLTYTIVAEVALVFAIVGVLRNASTAGPLDLDALLLKIPVVSPIYQEWFREDTYYREDTRSVYLKHFPDLIRALAEEVSAAKGIKLLPYLQRKPQPADLKEALSKATLPPEQ
jgi:hypothetical protein